MKRRIYLRMKPLHEAREAFLERIPVGGFRGPEEIPAVEACGRVTAAPVFARLSCPRNHLAAMDGYAVRAEDTFGAHPDHPVRLQVGRDAHPVNTGFPLPRGTNSVVMIEDVLELDPQTIQLESPVYPWENVRRVGEDVVATELLFPQNHRLSAYDIGALLAAGVTRVLVRPRPVVSIIPTGRELVEWEEWEKSSSLAEDQIVEFNSFVISAMLRNWGAEPRRWEIVRDDPDELRMAVSSTIEVSDLVIVNAGSSAGSEDMTIGVLEEMGEIIAHGISMMPGKPTILAIVRGKPVVGNPGYPVSAVFCCEQIVKPALERLVGVELPLRQKAKARVTRKIPCRVGLREFVRVRLGEVDGSLMATPLPRGAGSITTLTRADGILEVPENVEGYGEGEEVWVELLRTPEELRKTLVSIGSHDLTLDLINDMLRAKGAGWGLASSNVGSLGGLMAIRKGQAHLAGTHLLDPGTGEYNLPYIERYLRGVPVKLVHLVNREQGLMVAPGNPLGIEKVEDLARPEVRFINRQAGSGTRVLLDFCLEKAGVDPQKIRGYEREEYTHMAVAVAVATGTADAGMGILAAARALGLDFVPIASERYDLVIPERFFHTEGIVALLDVIRSEEFRKAVSELGGYDPSRSGEILL